MRLPWMPAHQDIGWLQSCHERPRVGFSRGAAVDKGDRGSFFHRLNTRLRRAQGGGGSRSACHLSDQRLAPRWLAHKHSRTRGLAREEGSQCLEVSLKRGENQPLRVSMTGRAGHPHTPPAQASLRRAPHNWPGLPRPQSCARRGRAGPPFSCRTAPGAPRPPWPGPGHRSPWPAPRPCAQCWSRGLAGRDSPCPPGTLSARCISPSPPC